jgi:CheY-like chemotaxis protein
VVLVGRYTDGRMPTLLVVEDEPDIRSGIVEVLRDEGHLVFEASDGGEALAVLHAGARPNAIILDLMMPHLDGYGFRAAQLADPELASIPVLVVSAHGRGLPETPHLAKPFELTDLLVAVARILGPSGESPAPP